MQSDPHNAEADEPPAILDRTDGGGAWSKAWPLIALALIGLMVVATCVPTLPLSAPVPVGAPAPR